MDRASSMLFFKRFKRFFAQYLKHNLKLQIGLTLLIALILMILITPIVRRILFSNEDPLTIGKFDRYLPPSFEHPLGTDLFGRDVFILVLEGLKNSLLLGVETGIIATLIGAFVGVLSGYKGGICDAILRTLADNMLVLPVWPILVILALYARINDMHSFSLILAVFSWAWIARTIRAQVLYLKEMPYVDLAKVSGLGTLEIITKEITPNLLPYIGVGLSNAVISAILMESGVRLIGLGPPTVMTLGLLIQYSMNWGVLSLGMYSIILPPISLVIILFASLNLINTGLEEQFNPKIKKITGE
jgi:peptide/nickel transport system permease protein